DLGRSRDGTVLLVLLHVASWHAPSPRASPKIEPIQSARCTFSGLLLRLLSRYRKAMEVTMIRAFERLTSLLVVALGAAAFAATTSPTVSAQSAAPGALNS